MSFHPALVFLLAPCGSGIENREERPKAQLLCFKSTTRTTEATNYWKPTPAHWCSTSSWTQRLGQATWTSYAPEARRSFHRSCFIRELAKEVMTTHDIIFASRPQFLATRIIFYDSTDIAFAPYSDYWRELRKICTQELLNAKRVQSYRPIREKEVLNLIEWISSRAGSPINLTQKVKSSIYSITAQAAFGNECKDQEEFIYAVKDVIKAISGFNVADVFPSFKLLHMISGEQHKVERLQKQVDRILENIIKEHMQATTKKRDEAHVQEDLVDILLKFHDHCGGRELSLTINNIKAVILDVFTTGSDPSAAVVDWTMSEMIKHPRIMKRAQDEVREVFNRARLVNETSIRGMKYLKLVIQESLRLHPPGVLLLPRECAERCVIDGYEIPAKTRVIVNAWAIGRDPNYWSNPETFNPDRFLDSSIDYQGTNFDYIPFGAGRRICPGMLYGLANVELPLAICYIILIGNSPMK